MGKTPRRLLSSEKLGEKGESRFKELCTDADLIANKSTIDAMGWDYLVECPYPVPDAATPLDKRPHPIECKVQVKTVWDGTNHVTLKLSAAERLAKSDRPSFIVVLSVGTKFGFVSMHIFHMLDQHLEHTLKRLRKATAEGSLKINHAQLAFNLRDGVSMTPDGASLRQFIMDACGSDSTAYFNKKQDQLTNLGFGQLRYEGEFKLRAMSESETAELFLGLRSATLVSFETREIRFGIKLPSHTGGAGIIKITPRPAAKCKIIARGRDDSPTVNIPGALYLTPQRNRDGIMRFRISTTLLDIFVNGTDMTIKNNVADFMTTPVVIKDMLATLKFHSVIAGGGGQIMVIAQQKQIARGEIDTAFDQEVLEDTNRRIRLVEMTAAVFKAADAQSRPISLSSMADKFVDIMFLNDLINNEGKVTVNPITFRPTEKLEFPLISEALLIRQICFLDFVIAYYVVIDVTLTDRPPDIVLDVGSATLRDITVIDGGDDAFDAYVEEARLTTGIAMSLVMRTESRETVTGQCTTD